MNTLVVPPGHAAAISVRYSCDQTARSALIVAVLLSLGVHLAMLFGLRPAPAAARGNSADHSTVVPLTVFKLDELEEPEPFPADEAIAPTENAPLVPALVDSPTVPAPEDFVQRVDLSSLLERPHADTANLMAIPANYARHAQSRGAGTIFNPSDLDRAPVAIAQSPPVYPMELRREAATATVLVGFIVDSAGTVVNAQVVESTHPGFNAAAIAGVSKWKFRAGVRSGRRVNTRMQIPIVFRISE